MTYTLTGDILKQDATLTKIKNIKFDYRYQQHLDSLESYPILPGSIWPKKEGLVEGKDFRLEEDYTKGTGATVYAVPIVSLREEPQERADNDELLNGLSEVCGLDVIAMAVFEYLKQHYNITRK